MRRPGRRIPIPVRSRRELAAARRERDSALATLSAIALHLDTIGVRQADGSVPDAREEAANARIAAVSTLTALGYDEFARRVGRCEARLRQHRSHAGLTAVQADELERLEAAFEASGGRGVELAERIDELRALQDD